MSTSVARHLVEALRQRGVARVFGIPGGGSSLDLIEETRRAGIDFVLTRREDAAVIMAAVTAELEHTLGVALTTKGPGTANAVNGVAYAALDRAPVLLVTDGFSPALLEFATHQVFDQRALLQPLVKAHSRLDGEDAAAELAGLLAAAVAAPPGAVCLELTGPAARESVDRPPVGPVPGADPGVAGIDEAAERLARAIRPVLVVGLEARAPGVPEAVRELVSELACPVLTTYKAKGVVSDRDPHYVGLFTGGQAEAACVRAADLIVEVGLDPVELILKPWPYELPILRLGACAHPVRYAEAETAVFGDLAAQLRALMRRRPGRASGTRPHRSSNRGWSADELALHRKRQADAIAYRGRGDGVSPAEVVELASRVSGAEGRRPRVAVDAGAHMFSATALWPARSPNDVLISNGLATMGYAIPAAVAAALHDPERGALAFTGDGGAMMCAAELATAADVGARLVVVVFNDATLSLIDIKQKERALPSRGVGWRAPDFAQVARGFGCEAWRVTTAADYRDALGAAFRASRPALIDVTVDPSGYPDQLRALRG